MVGGNGVDVLVGGTGVLLGVNVLVGGISVAVGVNVAVGGNGVDVLMGGTGVVLGVNVVVGGSAVDVLVGGTGVVLGVTVLVGRISVAVSGCKVLAIGSRFAGGGGTLAACAGLANMAIAIGVEVMTGRLVATGLTCVSNAANAVIPLVTSV